MSVFHTLSGRWALRAPAITYESGVTSYGELLDRSLRAGSWLREQGVSRGDIVALHLGKEQVFLELHLGALAIGAVTLPIHSNATAAEVRGLLADCEAKLLVDDPAVRRRIESCPRAEVAPVEPDELAVLCYTSGTTGRPKGAQISHANLLATIRSLHEAWQWSSDDVLVHALPLFHIHGLFVAQHGALYAGAHSRWLRRFEVEAALDTMCESTVFMGVPTYYSRLIAAGPGGRDLSRMRLFTSGSAPLQAADHKAFETAFGHRILERYGMTEVGIVLSNPYDGERRPGSVGFPLPGVHARITDLAGEPTPAGEVGEVRIKGESVCRGYLGRPEATRAALGDGWMHTGDLGWVDEDGYFHIAGRMTDMILSGGLNVYPREIEAVLAADPAVAEVAVFGIPDPDLGERVCAAVVPGRAWDPDALSQVVRGQLNAYKLPRRWFRVDELPRNALGKVLKAQLRQEYAVLVRPGGVEDAERIVRWNQALANETEDFQLDAEVLASGVRRALLGTVGAQYLIASRKGQPAGQMMLTREWSDWRNAEVWWIQSVYIEPQHRRRGVYAALHTEAARRAKAAGAAGLRLYVETENAAAMTTYERLGMSSEHYRMYEQMFGESG